MDKILILDGDAGHVQFLKSELNKTHQFEVVTATSAEKAIELIKKTKISVFVTEIFPPDMDALDLMAYMTQNRPKTPCIVISDNCKPWFKEKITRQSFLYHMEKPLEIGKLVSAIFVGLNLRDEGKNLKGMTMASILPLVETLKKTCRLEGQTKNKAKGYLYFKDGMLIDAHYKDLNAEAAAMEMAQWEQILIKISELPDSRTRSRIKTTLMDMAGASWDKSSDCSAEKISVTSERIQSVFQQYQEEFNRIKGFQDMAVIMENGEFLTSNKKNETLDLLHLAVNENLLFDRPDQQYFLNIEKGEAVTLHKQNHNIVILYPKQETHPRIRLVGVSSAKGNWIYLKMNLTKILDEILAFSV